MYGNESHYRENMELMSKQSEQIKRLEDQLQKARECIEKLRTGSDLVPCSRCGNHNHKGDVRCYVCDKPLK